MKNIKTYITEKFRVTKGFGEKRKGKQTHGENNEFLEKFNSDMATLSQLGFFKKIDNIFYIDTMDKLGNYIHYVNDAFSKCKYIWYGAVRDEISERKYNEMMQYVIDNEKEMTFIEQRDTNMGLYRAYVFDTDEAMIGLIGPTVITKHSPAANIIYAYHK